MRLLKRDHHCGELGNAQVGKTVVLNGWVERVRHHGGLIFLDLRDRSGLVQVVFNPAKAPAAHAAADRARAEYVVAVRGDVRERPTGAENPQLPTGTVEVHAQECQILSPCKAPPFLPSERVEVDENVRLKYRYLDLRRPVMKAILELRHHVSLTVRNFLSELGFWEVETPILLKSTPEGARDFLVPSRLQPGNFYALTQSPQLMKQVLMVSGVERYFQLARCLRDEDPRADRQVEHTQVDIEMSFVEERDVMEVVEALMVHLFRQFKGVDLGAPFPRLSYEECMRRFGTDKPDLRFGMEIVDLSEAFVKTSFTVFRRVLDGGGVVRGLLAPGCATFSRKEIEGLQAFAAQFGAKGLVSLAFRDAEVAGPAVKLMSQEDLAKAPEALGAKEGDLALIVAGGEMEVTEPLNRLRQRLGEELCLIDQGQWHPVWVVDFPLLEWNQQEARFDAMHHPFTSPRDEDLPLLTTDPAKVRAKLYDLVINGYEIGSGSIRIHQREIQEQVFSALNVSPEQAHQRFGFLLEAFEYGAPPHGGIALGLDRILVLLTGASSIREVIPFPKTQSAVCPLTGAPSPVDPSQLAELHIAVRLPDEQDKAAGS